MNPIIANIDATQTLLTIAAAIKDTPQEILQEISDAAYEYAEIKTSADNKISEALISTEKARVDVEKAELARQEIAALRTDIDSQSVALSVASNAFHARERELAKLVEDTEADLAERKSQADQREASLSHRENAVAVDAKTATDLQRDLEERLSRIRDAAA